MLLIEVCLVYNCNFDLIFYKMVCIKKENLKKDFLLIMVVLDSYLCLFLGVK